MEEHCVLQADAFLRGRTDIENKHYLNDLVTIGSHRYVVNPPIPSVLLMPFVAILGTSFANGFLLAVALTIVNVRQIYALATLLKQRELALALTGAFLLGTGYWFCFTQSDGMWFLAHTVSFTFALAALKECFDDGRPWLMGVWLGCSFLSRQITIYLGVFLMLMLVVRSSTLSQRIRRLSEFLAAVSIAVGLYLWFNWARFGDPFDTGYAKLEQPLFLNERQLLYGIFHWLYIPANAIHMFWNGFHVQLQGEDLLSGWSMSLWGTSLTFASPFVFLALWSRLSKATKAAAWISISFMVIHILSYHANGWKQINCYRYSLDFMPLLFLLSASAIIGPNVKLWKACVVYAVVLNCLALVVVPVTNSLFRCFV
jgi:hypothetical protein